MQRRCNQYYYSHWSHLVQTPQILWGFKDKNSHALVVSCVFSFTQVLYKQACCGLIQSLFVKRSLITSSAFFLLLPGHRCAISYTSFILRSPCQTKSLLLQRRVLLQWPLTLLSSFLRPQPTLPVTTTHRTLTTTWFLCPNLRLQRLAFPLSSCSFGSVPGSVLLVLVFAFVLLVYFCHLSTRLQFSCVSLCFHVCVTTLQLKVRRRCTS